MTEHFWNQVACRLHAGMSVFISMVVAHTRGSPGTSGAHFCLDEKDQQFGTIGGGIMEANLIKRGQEILAGQQTLAPELQLLVHRKVHTDAPSGLICAGEQKNLNFTLSPDQVDLVDTFCEALENQVSQKLDLVIKSSGLSLDKKEPHTPNQSGLLLEQRSQDDWQVRESSLNPKRLTIVGAGHCGSALARLANELGYWVDIYDNRASIIQGANLPKNVRAHLLQDYAELTQALTHKTITTVVVMTTTAFDDIDALTALANEPVPWLGVMGARAKLNLIHKTLKERGIAKERIERIHGPIGLDIKSDTPPEIAVSVMGQLLQEAAKKRTHKLKHV